MWSAGFDILVQMFDYVRKWSQDREERGWWHSFELPDGRRIQGVCSVESLQDRIGRFPIPADLTGQRVLDIGTWDGWFAFEMERRGADVVAIDDWDNPRFREMHAMVNSRVDYRQFDVYDLTPESVGRFDIVLFMGVLYHLKHPLLALEKVCALTTGMAVVDSFILREEHRPGAQVDTRPIMEFYETTEFGGQTDNWVGPSLACLLAFCRTAGFARAELQSVLDHGACVACFRHWEAAEPGAPAGPEVLAAFHSRDFGMNFRSDRDETVVAWIAWAGEPLTVDQVKPEAGGYGVRPVEVRMERTGEMAVVFKLPPGLKPGIHDVRVRVPGSAPGKARPIAIDMPAPDTSARLSSACDGITWAPDQIDLSKGDTLTVWVEGLPPNADHNNVKLRLGNTPLRISYVEPAAGEARRQINVQVPLSMPAGETEVRLMDSPGLPVHVIHQQILT